jgi:hypothetical protein
MESEAKLRELISYNSKRIVLGEVCSEPINTRRKSSNIPTSGGIR